MDSKVSSYFGCRGFSYRVQCLILSIYLEAFDESFLSIVSASDAVRSIYHSFGAGSNLPSYRRGGSAFRCCSDIVFEILTFKMECFSFLYISEVSGHGYGLFRLASQYLKVGVKVESKATCLMAGYKEKDRKVPGPKSPSESPLRHRTSLTGC